MAASGVAPGVFLNPLPPSGPPRLHQPDPLEPDPCPTWTASGPGVEGPRGRYPDQGVLIRGDAKLNYQDLADVLSACETAGIRNVRLPVRTRDAQAVPAAPRP